VASRNSLEKDEVALIKAFIRFTNINDQEILAYFSRPGRSLNHRVIREIRSESHFRDERTATEEELRAFRARWLEPSPFVVDGQRRIRTLDRASDALGLLNRDQYWIGARINYAEIWAAYESGLAYIDKFHSTPAHVLTIEFESAQSGDPLFDHEAVFKTLKGLFHDLKKENMSEKEYNASSPMFLYSVERGSSIYRFLGGLREMLMHGMTLSEEKIMKIHLDNTQRRIDFVRKNFRNVDEEAVRTFVMARTTYDMDAALEKLMTRGIKSVKISADPIQPHLEIPAVRMIELKEHSQDQLKQTE
jgi:hypothetical protein